MNFKPLSLTLLLLASTSTLLAHADERFCNPNTTDTAPDGRFEDIGNGEVKDSKTNLIWQRCSIGQTWNGTACTGEATTDLTWQQALKKAKALGNGYRLPNYKEAISITNYSCKPAINSNIFQIPVGDNHLFWTSTPHARDNKQVLLFDFETADAFYQDIDGRVTKEFVYGFSSEKIPLALPVRSAK